MKLIGYAILKEVTKKRVITLGEAKKLFVTDFKDKRDFFALASLYTAGYVDTSWVKEGCNWDITKNSLVAEELYLMSLGPGKHNVEGVPEFTNEQDYNLELKIYCTSKCDLFFHEQRSKRIDRIVTLSIGILVALVSAAATSYFTKTMSVIPAPTKLGSAWKLESVEKVKNEVVAKTTKGLNKIQPSVPPDRRETVPVSR